MGYIEKLHGEDLIYMLMTHVKNYKDNNEAIMEFLDNSIDSWSENGFRPYGRKSGEKGRLDIKISIFPGHIEIKDNAGGLGDDSAQRMIRFAHKNVYRNTLIGGFGLGFKAGARKISGGELVYISWIEPNHNESALKKRKINFSQSFWNVDKTDPHHAGINDQRNYVFERGGKEQKADPESEFEDLKGLEKGETLVHIRLAYQDQGWWEKEVEVRKSKKHKNYEERIYLRYEKLKKKIEDTYAQLVVEKKSDSGLDDPIRFSFEAHLEGVKQEGYIDRIELQNKIENGDIPGVVPRFGLRSWMWVPRFHPSKHHITWKAEDDLGKKSGKDLKVVVTAGIRMGSTKRSGKWGGLYLYGNDRLFHNGDWDNDLMNIIPKGGTLAKALRFKAVVEFTGDCIDIPWNPYKTGIGKEDNQEKIIDRIRDLITKLFNGYLWAIEKSTPTLIGETNFPRTENIHFDEFRHHSLNTSFESISLEKTGEVLKQEDYGFFDRVKGITNISVNTQANRDAAKKWKKKTPKTPPGQTQEGSHEIKLKFWKHLLVQQDLKEDEFKKAAMVGLFEYLKKRNTNFEKSFKSPKDLFWRKLKKGDSPPWKKKK